ncbi:reverse transcriptase domain-containing protein [Pedobacter sp. FW305-3-2-15-E-R2A2]|uniref:reverse transcriptase domain-containing protein n=1 Tax=Pedobacter sp. FW305-3-2-15-E-R2A2 TaxID=3140251 RepID=UPI00313FF0BF
MRKDFYSLTRETWFKTNHNIEVIPLAAALFNLMKDFETYFEFYSVLEQLVIARSKIAFYIHKHSYLDKYVKGQAYNIRDTIKNQEIETICELLPPRKEWSRPTSYADRKAFESTIELNQKSIKNRVHHVHRLFTTKQIDFLSTPLWYQRLRRFIFNLNIYVFQNPNLIIAEPSIIPARKPPYSKTDKVRRPLAKFKIEDKIILSLTNKYLTKIFDHIFLDCSFAFRSRNSFSNVPTYNDAVKFLQNFRKENIQIPLYVAECDIKKFFDCVDHKIVLSKYNSVKKKLKLEKLEIHPIAEIVFKAYLNCYSFNSSVYPLNMNQSYWDHMKDNIGHFEWTIELDTKFQSGDLVSERIGIPQGGALSGLIVNLIMHDLDLSIFDCKKWNKEYLYLRYCDDMVIVHRSHEECDKLFKTYFENLKLLNLIPHLPPKLELSYSKSFWGKSIKSRNVYHWTDKKHKILPHSPWVSFLGYMIKDTAELKIRKSSIEKQVLKHNSELQKVIKKLEKCSNFDLINQELSIIRSFESKLVSMAVGTVNIGNYKNEPLKMCWGAGFKLIDSNKYIELQLRKLDSSRKIVISRLKSYFNEREIEHVKNEDEDPPERILNYNYPYSFFSLLDRPKDIVK